jgi:type VI secretion system secreted protein Hcp
VYIPIDPSTNLPAGTRKHDPFVFTKHIDASTPYLNNAVCQSQTYSKVIIRSYKVDGSGVEREYFQCVLDNVKVVKVAPVLNNVCTTRKKAAPLEQVALVYGKITWTYADGNLQYSDDLSNR